jgi:hypothetical protein
LAALAAMVIAAQPHVPATIRRPVRSNWAVMT